MGESEQRRRDRGLEREIEEERRMRRAAVTAAMGQAPEAVRSVATDQLRATAATGGGVAEAIERWLGPSLPQAAPNSPDAPMNG